MSDDYNLRTKCAVCEQKKLFTIMNFGEVPLAGDYPEKPNVVDNYNLNLLFCENCKLLQTDSFIGAERLFGDYRYMSSVGLTKHFTEVASMLQNYFHLNSESKILEIGSNDGVLLKPLMDLGLFPKGIEPAKNIAQISKDKGCDVEVNYFSEFAVDSLEWVNKFDLIISNNCFAHIDAINSIVKGIKKALKPHGHLVIEVHYVKPLITSLQYDNIYHEHIYYYSLNSLNNLFKSHGMSIVDYDEIPIHAGSLRVYVKNSSEKLSNKIKDKLEEEAKLGLTSKDWYENFSEKSKKHIYDTKNYIKNLVNMGYKIAGYGASGRANIACNLYNFDNSVISYIVDESPERTGRYIAGTDIPIVSKEYLAENKPDYIIIFAWNFSKMIIEKLAGNDYTYIVAFPNIQVVKKFEELHSFVGV
jgi:SAM-dependent methyltransferase